MVSFWPFGGDDKSAASFEKALSQLSTKINKISASNDKYRLRQRKYKVLWTIYAVFTYILIDAILVLVTGWEKWSFIEYTVVAGGPPFIYAIRTGLDSYYGYRVTSSQDYLNDLYKQREEVIGRLKSATKYDSTQELLNKYGGSPKGKPQSDQQHEKQQQLQQKGGNASVNQLKSNAANKNRQSWSPGDRTGVVPPPTANIPTRQPAQAADRALPESRSSTLSKSHGPPPSEPAGEEFAPNAFAPPQRPPMVTQPSQYANVAPKWYDRILDVMLGEDEASARNRIVLLCEHCRLVNGQAPPGARTLEDIGRWRCGNCHAWNGVESEEKKILTQITQSQQASDPNSIGAEGGTALGVPAGEVTDDGEEYEHVEETGDTDAEDAQAETDIGSSSGRSTETRLRPRKKV